MTITITNHRARRDWRNRARRFAWTAQAIAKRKDAERRAWEAYYEGAAEEALFERYHY